MGLGLSGLRLGLGQRGGGKSLGSIAASYGGAAILIDAGSVFQDRSATPSTPASVGDPVGTIVGTDGVYFAIAPNDASRGTLAEDSSGRLYIDTTPGASRYLVQDGSATYLAAPYSGFTAILGSMGWGTAFAAAGANDAGDLNRWSATPLIVQLRNSGGGYTVVGWDEPAITPFVERVAFSPAGVGFRYNGKIMAASKHIEDTAPYDYSAASPQVFAIGTKTAASASGGPDRFYGGIFLPVPASTSDMESAERLLIASAMPPAAPADTNIIDLDFVNDTFEWGGSAKVIGDLTDNANGSYSLAYPAAFGSAYMYSVDYHVPDQSLHSDLTEIFALVNADTTDGLHVRPDSASPPGTRRKIPYLTSNQAYDSAGASDDGTLEEGLLRITVCVRPPANPMVLYQGITRTAAQPAVFTLPWASLRVWEDFGTGNVQRVRARGGAFSDAEVLAFHRESDNYPIRFVADSFGSAAALERTLTAATEGAIGYIPTGTTSTGGAGWDVLAPQYLAEDEYIRADTLVMHNGADETSYSIAAGLAHIHSMTDALDGHDRWIYMESNPQNAIGNPARTTWETYQAAYMADMGVRYIPTLKAHQCAHLDNANDISDVGNGLWPRSQTGDLTHPNSIGQEIRARCTLGALLRLGYLSGISQSVPGAPTSLSASGQDLTWDMPADDGNDPVREWTVYLEDSPGAGTYTVVYTGQLRQHTLSSLAAGTWGVRVTATNENGEGTYASTTVTSTAGELVTNGSFDDGLTDWTVSLGAGGSTGASVTAGTLTIDGVLGGNAEKCMVYQALSTVSGVTYDVVMTHAALAYVYVGTTPRGFDLYQYGQNSFQFTATGSTTYLSLTHPNSTADVTYSEVSVQAA